MTPLHIATKAAHIDVVKVLIKRGANIEAKTSAGKTALMIADENSHPDIFTFVLEKGAKVE
jgi:ankyrin repeat domain-containing protein 17